MTDQAQTQDSAADFMNRLNEHVMGVQVPVFMQVCEDRGYGRFTKTAEAREGLLKVSAKLEHARQLEEEGRLPRPVDTSSAVLQKVAAAIDHSVAPHIKSEQRQAYERNLLKSACEAILTDPTLRAGVEDLVRYQAAHEKNQRQLQTS